MPGKVPESVLKKRKTLDEIKAKRVAAKTETIKKKKVTRKEIFKRAEKYVKEYRTNERELIRARRQAKNNGNFFVEDMPKVLLVVRVRGINRVAPKTKKILQLLRLRQINNATFMKVNFATMTMLQYIEPYVTYGKPTLKTINDLIYKRGFGKVNKQRIPLTDNKVIEGVLGDSVERAYKLYPVLIGITITINCFFIMYKGSPQLNLDETPVGRGIGISFAFGIGLAVLLHIFAIPWMRKRVDAQNYKTLVELAEEKGAANMELGEFKSVDTRAGITDDIDASIEQAKLEKAVETDTDVIKAKLMKARGEASNINGVDPDAVAAAFSRVQEIHNNAEKFEPKAEGVFVYLQVFTAIFDAFSHGANDVANAIGPFAAVWAIYDMQTLEEVSKKVPVPVWILAMGGAGIVVGLGLYGYKIITAIGVKLTKITPSRGFSIELGAALVICVGSYLELPLSTTHCQVGATLGVAAFEGVAAGIDWKAMGVVATGWVVTLIFCGFISAGLFSFAVYSPSMKYAESYGSLHNYSNVEL